MCWGSDFPVVKPSMTYLQSIEAFRTYCDFVDQEDKKYILGKTLEKLLSASKKVTKSIIVFYFEKDITSK